MADQKDKPAGESLGDILKRYGQDPSTEDVATLASLAAKWQLSDNELLKRISDQLGILLQNVPSPPTPDAAMWEEFYGGPAVAANRIGMVPAPGVVRIAFGEQYTAGAPTHFRAAVIMTDYNAWELWKLLEQSPAVQYWEQQYKEGQKAAAQDADGPKPE